MTDCLKRKQKVIHTFLYLENLSKNAPPPNSTLYKLWKPTILTTDACNYAISVVFSQKEIRNDAELFTSANTLEFTP